MPFRVEKILENKETGELKCMYAWKRYIFPCCDNSIFVYSCRTKFVTSVPEETLIFSYLLYSSNRTKHLMKIPEESYSRDILPAF